MLSQPEAISHQNTEVVLVIKALCGHFESGKNWATKFGATMKEEGWEISKADPKVWMKRNGDHHKCVDSYKCFLNLTD